MENNIYKEDIRLLRKAKSENRLVIFVGAGISKYSGLPLWGESINKISDLLNISNDSIDYLKIPQYYYNSRGKKEYTELMREIFGYQKNYIPNEIHKQIINLNVHTIITTNYDDLLEIAAKNNMSFVQVIRQDKDLAYCTSGRKIIKMHGAFETDNFVLKEDDYLNYSNNFKLIETHIKSLLARNVVLFLGYSYNDPDVKQLFNWVKEILKEDFQRAYLFNAFDSYNANIEQYYKNLGINIISASKQYGKEFLKENSKDYIVNFLKDINKNYNNVGVDCLSINDLYKDLNLLSQLNYISIKNFDSIFRKYGFGIDYDTRLYNYDTYNKELKKILEELYGDKDKIQSYDNDTIKMCLKKSSISEITLYDYQNSKNLINRYDVDFEKSKYRNLLINFDIDKINAMKKVLSFEALNNRAMKYLEYAYICFECFDYYDAYINLKNSSMAFYEDKNYVWYMISEYNRNYVGKFIVGNPLYGLDENIINSINEEISHINFDLIFDEIKVENYDQKIFLKDIYASKRYYLAYQNVLKINKKIEKNEKKNQTTIFGKLPIERLKSSVMDIFNFDLYNYIMMDNYIEKIDIYRVYIERIILTYFSKNTKDNIENIKPIDLFIIIKYSSYEDLTDLLESNCKIRILLSDENVNYISNVIDNIYNCDITYGKDYFKKFLVLAKYLKLGDEIIVKIMKKFENLLDYDNLYVFYIGDEKNFMDFFNKEYMQGSQKFQKALLEIIDKVIDKIILNEQYYQLKKVLMIYLSIYRKFNDEPIEKLNELFLKKDFELCIDIYQLLTDEKKYEVKNMAKCNRKIKFSEYIKLLLNDIVDPIEEYEKKLIEEIKKMKNIPIDFGNNSHSLDLLILYVNDKIINKDDVKKLLVNINNDKYGWLMDAKNYNYKNFDINYLKKCNKKLLESISLNETMHSKIKEKIKESFLDGLCDSEMAKIYFMYFDK